MADCWSFVPAERPSFKTIVSRLDGMNNEFLETRDAVESYERVNGRLQSSSEFFSSVSEASPDFVPVSVAPAHAMGPEEENDLKKGEETSQVKT